ncbi:MAG: hypothetical protein HZB38_02760 [Planctomycetes bacterium]|nr:hypothetical protein [Planctomycetota bacterium]
MQHDNPMPPRRRLSDILNGGTDSLRTQWNSTTAADDFKPLPTGLYVARVVSGELFTSRTNHTPGYKLTFRVLEGEHAGRQFWHDCWLSPAALPMSRRDLGKLGVTSVDQLETPLPTGIRCTVKLALRRDDDGTEYNRVRSFDVTGIDEAERDPFAPTDDPIAPSAAATGTPEGGEYAPF